MFSLCSWHHRVEKSIFALVSVTAWALVHDYGPKLSINHTDLDTTLNKGVSFTLGIKTPDKFLEFSIKIGGTSVLWVPYRLLKLVFFSHRKLSIQGYLFYKAM